MFVLGPMGPYGANRAHGAHRAHGAEAGGRRPAAVAGGWPAGERCADGGRLPLRFHLFTHWATQLYQV